RKVVAGWPSGALRPEPREAMEAGVERACRHIGYLNAGTYEFILGPDGEPFFIEVNCRLQVEHPVTELLTGVDIVREQIEIAAGQPLPVTGRAPRSGHAIEIRINAEDPSRDFVPAPGVIRRFRPPLRPAVRVDPATTGAPGFPPSTDPMIARVLVRAEDRRSTIARALRALRELEVEGVPTTRELAIDVLASDEFGVGEYSTSYLAEMEHRL